MALTQINPALFAGSSNTTAVIQSNGTTAITVDSSQNVGIGVAPSSSKLSIGTTAYVQQVSVAQVNGASLPITNNAGIFNIGCTDAAAADVGGSLGFTANGGVNGYSAGQISGRRESATSSVYSSYMAFSTTSSNSAITEKMRIDSAGNVGIGITAPTQKLHVNGPMLIGNGGATQYLYFDSTLHYVGRNTSTGDTWLNCAGGQNIIFGVSSTEKMKIDGSGGLILAGSTAQKATGTTWSNPSDKRLKDNIRDYSKGLAELIQVRVREWEYNGKGGTVEGTKGLGVIADEVMTVLPNTVENYDAKLNADDDETTAIKKFDATEITWLLVKSLQELKAELDTVKAELVALRNK